MKIKTKMKKLSAVCMTAMIVFSGMAIPTFAATGTAGVPEIGTNSSKFFDTGVNTSSSRSETTDFDVAVDNNFSPMAQTAENMSGVDPAQEKNTMYLRAMDTSEDVEVYAALPSTDIMIYIPKTVILEGGTPGGDEHWGQYMVAVTGNVDPAVDVTVTPDASATYMVNQGNAEIKYPVLITQQGTRFNGDDVKSDLGSAGAYTTKTVWGNVRSQIERAGTYKGTFTFHIDLEAESPDLLCTTGTGI